MDCKHKRARSQFTPITKNMTHIFYSSICSAFVWICVHLCAFVWMTFAPPYLLSGEALMRLSMVLQKVPDILTTNPGDNVFLSYFLYFSSAVMYIHLFFIGSLKLNNTSFFFCETSVLYERNFLIIKSPMKTFISVLSILSTHTLTHPHTHPHVIFSLPIQYSAPSYTACFCHDSYISIKYIII